MIMDTGLVYIWAWLAIGLSWLWVALGQSQLAKTSIEILGKNPKLISTLRVYTILWIALVESAVIYGLIVALQILWAEGIHWLQALGAWLAIWLTGFWAGFGEWKMVAWSLDAVNRNPQNKTTVLQFMILFLALIEVVAIYGLIIAQKLIN